MTKKSRNNAESSRHVLARQGKMAVVIRGESWVIKLGYYHCQCISVKSDTVLVSAAGFYVHLNADLWNVYLIMGFVIYINSFEQ